MNVVVVGKHSEFHEINVCVPHGPLFGPTLFLLFFLLTIRQEALSGLYVNIYDSDTTIYERTSKKQHDRRHASDLSPDQLLTVQWRKTGL